MTSSMLASAPSASGSIARAIRVPRSSSATRRRLRVHVSMPSSSIHAA
jgi:hypothetical protein